MFIRLEIRAKENIYPCVATGKKSNESDDIILNSDSVISAHEVIGESLNQSGMSGMQSSGQSSIDTSPKMMTPSQ